MQDCSNHEAISQLIALKVNQAANDVIYIRVDDLELRNQTALFEST